jgi:phosphoribosylanthranilate isomerase
MLLKICGLKNKENIEQIAALKPNLMGFIFYSQSKRFVGENFVMPVLSSEIKKVGVFVNAKADYIIEKINEHKLDIIQLHGDESASFCESMSHFIPVIKAFGVDDNFDFKKLDKYTNSCAYFLFDTKTADYGGSGKQFNHELLKKYDGETPFFLSGGIGLEEIEKLKIKKLNIHAIDVNSKFETEPGIKDIEMLKLITHHL